MIRYMKKMDQSPSQPFTMHTERHIDGDSPASPSTRDVSDHIWDARITAVEVFYFERQSTELLAHGLLLRDPSEPVYWQCDAEVTLPGIDHGFPCYASQDIVDIINSKPSSRNSTHSRRSRRSRHGPATAFRTEVHSVRISYKGNSFFLDREKDDWHTWSGGSLTLTTYKLLEILPHAYDSTQSQWYY
jgi:hypothetical protein